ncbi:phosphate acyltransferase [Edaphobacter acidisoli]|uniref:Phosphate acyltransferase n=1 Tax=Edaphobacter acidisoli TaxID=2040573 RepID=A0A916W5S2_9BACT|nr:phosphate acyltransferase PlsX [Edaphobacter acidisoli]GGA68913.1 phosphate acyltransferase [Edaphobacter acidisoli]
MPIDIVVDAMGSDKAPEPEVRGAVLAARQYDVRVHLVGPEDKIRPLLRQALRGQRLPVFIVPASEWITMDDKAAQAVRAKRDSSMRVGLRMVREGLVSGSTHGPGKAAAFFTAGNTGAAMATAKMVLGMLGGVHRPALATIMPTSRGVPSLLLDVGANVDCDPDNLVQFAVMGNIYAKNVLHINTPRVGLLSIGEEDSKGNSLTRDTLPMLRALQGINFIGNVEGRDLFNGHSDVTVCDGFVGNVAIKSIEGCAHLMSQSLRESLKSTVTSQVGALLSRRAFADFKKRLDYSEYGGAPLLGVRGVCIVGHGSSNERAIMNGIRVAAEFAQAEVNSAIESTLQSA